MLLSVEELWQMLATRPDGMKPNDADATAIILAYRNAWLEVATAVAEGFVPSRLSTQTHGERIGERIRKLEEKP